MPRIWRDPLRFFQEVSEECGPVARVGLGKFTLYLISGATEVEEILQDSGKIYWKGKGLEVAELVMGQGLATSEGPHWQRQRKLMQPSFQPRRLGGLLPVLDGAVGELLTRWRERPAGRTFDLAADMDHLSQRAILRTMFGGDVAESEAEALGWAVREANAFINHVAWRFVPLPLGVPTPRHVRFRRALKTLDRVVYGLIEKRRAGGEDKDDLLGRLLAARDEQGQGMSDLQVRDEVMTQFVAGHETTTNALAWTLYLLGQNPEACARLREELGGLSSTETPGREELDGLSWLGAVIQESLRIYPPAWVLVRTPYQDVELGGYHIPKDSPLLISQWVMHRKPELWESPSEFRPERWLEANPERPRYAYFPFGGGRRTCIGNHFALLLMRLVLARLVPEFELELDSRRGVSPKPTTTLRPAGGVWGRVRPL